MCVHIRFIRLTILETKINNKNTINKKKQENEKQNVIFIDIIDFYIKKYFLCIENYYKNYERQYGRGKSTT